MPARPPSRQDDLDVADGLSIAHPGFQDSMVQPLPAVIIAELADAVPLRIVRDGVNGALEEGDFPCHACAFRCFGRTFPSVFF